MYNESMAEQNDDKRIGVTDAHVTLKAQKGSSSAFDTPKGRRLRPGKPENK